MSWVLVCLHWLHDYELWAVVSRIEIYNSWKSSYFNSFLLSSLALSFYTIAIHSNFSSVLCCHIIQNSIFLFLLMLITVESFFQLVINTQNLFLSYFFLNFISRLLNKFLHLSSKQLLKSSHFFFTLSCCVNSKWYLNYFNHLTAHSEVS